MTDDDKALVAELRINDKEIYLPVLGKSADRIEALSAEVEKFSGLARLAILKAYDTDKALTAENERLRDRIERLRKALYAAYDDEPGWCDLTRAALGDTE